MADAQQAQAATTTETTTPQAGDANTQSATAAAEQATKPELSNDELREELRERERKADEDAEAASKALKEQGKCKELYEQGQKDLEAAKAETARRERQDRKRTIAERVGLP